jgi:hypothetical protein
LSPHNVLVRNKIQILSVPGVQPGEFFVAFPLKFCSHNTNSLHGERVRKRHWDLEGWPIYGVGFAGNPTFSQVVLD